MSPLTKEAIIGVLGPTDDGLAAELARTQASEEELREAHAWLLNDEILINEYRPLPKGRVAELMDILRSYDFPSDERD